MRCAARVKNLSKNKKKSLNLQHIPLHKKRGAFPRSAQVFRT
jgi:hypothetical protein